MRLEPNLNVHVSMRVTEEKLALLGSDALVRFSRDTPISAKYIEVVPSAKPQGALKAETIIPIKEGREVEDMPLIMKGGIQKLNSALGKIEPILNDAKQIGQTAQGMATSIDADRGVIIGQVKSIVKTVETTTTNISATVTSLLTRLKLPASLKRH
jgi:hypothetical protein